MGKIEGQFTLVFQVIFKEITRLANIEDNPVRPKVDLKYLN